MKEHGSPSRWECLDIPRVYDELLTSDTSPWWEIVQAFIEEKAMWLIARQKDLLPYREDLIQDAMMGISTSLSKFKGNCRLTTWMAQIACNKYNDMLRGHIQQKQQMISLEATTIAVVDEATLREPATSMESDYEQRDQVRAAWANIMRICMASANAKRNILLVHLAFIEKWPRTQIAAHLGMTVNAVNTTISLIRKAIREGREA